MRCKSCGWENPAGAQKCAKCNVPLTGSMVEQRAEPQSAPEGPMKATVREAWQPQGQQQGAVANHYVCSCGYPVPNGASVCPQCGTPVGSGQVQNQGYQAQAAQMPMGGAAMGGTVMGFGAGPVVANSFTLKPVAFQNEQVQYQPITFSGDNVVLNRQNTDPNNNTITSKEQAVIVHKADGWYIENRSAGNTTFVQVNREMKINPGDVIVLGNRAFEFGKL